MASNPSIKSVFHSLKNNYKISTYFFKYLYFVQIFKNIEQNIFPNQTHLYYSWLIQMANQSQLSYILGKTKRVNSYPSQICGLELKIWRLMKRERALS